MTTPADRAAGPGTARPIPLLTIDQVAELLNVSRRTVQRLAATGKLPNAIRIGSSVRWRCDVVQAWIEAGCPNEAGRKE